MKVKTPLLCPVSVLAHEPSCMDQIFSLISAPPLSTTTPDGKNLQLYTSPKCPSRDRCNHDNHKQHYLSPLVIVLCAQ